MATSTSLETRYWLTAAFLAEELSFTGAAKRLKMSQSGVSRRLNELEHRCGFRRFNRDHAKVTVRPLVDKELRIEIYLASRVDHRSTRPSTWVR